MSTGRGRRLPRAFYRRDPLDLAPDLLNKVVRLGGRSGRIVDVEAYCGALDPASHAYRGESVRNATMFGPPGRLYVYFTYGMHWCANVVGAEEGVAGAVLLRALAPLQSLDQMAVARPAARQERDLCSGPAKLCQAFGIDRSFDGADLPTADRGVTIVDDGVGPPTEPGISGRIGISAGADSPWRWYVKDDPNVSGRPRS